MALSKKQYLLLTVEPSLQAGVVSDSLNTGIWSRLKWNRVTGVSLIKVTLNHIFTVYEYRKMPAMILLSIASSTRMGIKCFG